MHPQKKNATTIAVEVKKSQHKYVIGPKGNTLQEILEKTGVSVEIPPTDSSSETVILRGEPDRLGQALTEVYAKVKHTYTHLFSSYLPQHRPSLFHLNVDPITSSLGLFGLWILETLGSVSVPSCVDFAWLYFSDCVLYK